MIVYYGFIVLAVLAQNDCFVTDVRQLRGQSRDFDRKVAIPSDKKDLRPSRPDRGRGHSLGL